MNSKSVGAVLFVKDLRKVAAFYSQALQLKCIHSDENHSVLMCGGFDLIVHQIPKEIADDIEIDEPPKRRIGGAIRLDYPVDDIAASRKLARTLGGDIDESPPEWADRNANFFLGYDPEGNQIGVREERSPAS